jgi:AcrR family transcriptional regulator
VDKVSVMAISWRWNSVRCGRTLFYMRTLFVSTTISLTMTSPDDRLPAPPWAGGRKPRRTALDRERIGREALRLIDAEGIDTASMRRVAAAFDTGPASLYAHVANKDALLRLAFDLALEELAPPSPEGDDWQGIIREWGLAVHDMLVRHNDLAKLNFAHIPSGPAMLAATERVLGLMIEGGVPAQVAAWGLDILSLYIGADAYEGWLFGQRFGGDENAEEAQAFFGGIADYFASLPADRFPYLVANVPALMAGGGEERFEFGLDMLIAGIASTAARKQRRR